MLDTITSATALAFHRFANKFPLLQGDEFKEFVADIKEHGLRDPITLYQNQILEGRNRYRACLRTKIEPRFEPFEGDDAAALAFVISKNIHRRHLKAKEKREAIAALLKADPSKSDRQIAGMIKASPTVVGKVRAEKEATGDVSIVDTRTDTKGRKQPAKKKATDKARLAKKQARVKEAIGQAESAKPDIIKGKIIKQAEAKPDDELVLLRSFAGFVLTRATVKTDPKDHADFKVLASKVRALLGVAS